MANEHPAVPASAAAIDAVGPRHDRLLNLDQLRELGIRHHRVTLIRLEAAGQFPRRVRPSPQTVAWLESEILAHIRQLAAARDIAA